MADEEVGTKTNKKTQAGRDVYETSDGEMVSEKSITFEVDGLFVNIPSIHDGVRYSDDEVYRKFMAGEIQPTSAHQTKEEAITAAKERSKSLKFNKGGTPMKRQMELFARGGLNDEGGMIDEESGNEVPVGGTREGVRDDIDANVSEGEFIFPEDVTRYIGLDKLMQLRQEAKMGLKKMEAMGQMGNSDEATMDDDMPFGMDDLIIVAGGEPDDDGEINMAVGGLATGTTNVVRTPDPVASVANQTVAPLGTTTRRLTPEITQPVRTTVDFKKLMGDAAIEYKEYRNAAGNNILVPFIGGKATFPIPDGYTLYTGTDAPVGAGTTPTDNIVADANTATQERRSNNDDRTNVALPPPEAIDWDNLSYEEYMDKSSTLVGTGRTFAKAATLFMGPLAIFPMAAMAHQDKKALLGATKLLNSGLLNAEQIAALKARTEGINEHAGGLVNNLLGDVFGGVIDAIAGALGTLPEEVEAVKKVAVETGVKVDPTPIKLMPQDDPIDDLMPGEVREVAPTSYSSGAINMRPDALDISAGQDDPINDLMPGEVREIAPTSYSSGAINMRPDALDIAPVTPVDTSTFPENRPPSVNAGAASNYGEGYPSLPVTGFDPDAQPYVTPAVQRADPLIDTNPYMSKPSGTLPFMNAMTDERNNALMQTDAMLRGNSADPQIQPYVTPDATRLQRRPTYDTSTPFGQEAASKSYLVESGADPEIMTPFIPPATTFPENRPPSVGGGAASNYGEGYIPPTPPRGASPFDSAEYARESSLTFPDRSIDSNSRTADTKGKQAVLDAYTPDATQKVQGGFGVTPEVPLDITETAKLDITETKPVTEEKTGLGAKVSKPKQAYKAGQSNQATAWENLPDVNLNQAYELSERYKNTGGTTVDNYVVGAVSDGSSTGILSDAEGYAIRSDTGRNVFVDEQGEYHRPTMGEIIKNGPRFKQRNVGTYDKNKISIASTDRVSTVTAGRKNELSPASKAKIGKDASGGDPNMKGAVWYNQPGTNVLTRKFPTAAEKKKIKVEQAKEDRKTSNIQKTKKAVEAKKAEDARIRAESIRKANEAYAQQQAASKASSSSSRDRRKKQQQAQASASRYTKSAISRNAGADGKVTKDTYRGGGF